jgi:hypothetical protein
MPDKWHRSWYFGCQFTNITCTDDSTNRLEEVIMKQFGCHVSVGGASLGGKSVEQASWPVFRLFFGNPNVFTN